MKQQANLTSELYDANFKSKLKINLEAQFMKPSRVPVSTLTGMDAKSSMLWGQLQVMDAAAS